MNHAASPGVSHRQAAGRPRWRVRPRNLNLMKYTADAARFSGGGSFRNGVLRKLKDPRVARVRVLDWLPPDATLRGQFGQQACRLLIKREPKLELGQLLAG